MTSNHTLSGLDLEQVVAEARAVTAERHLFDERDWAEEDWAEEDWADDWLEEDDWAEDDQSVDLTIALAAIDRLGARFRYDHARRGEDELARDAQLQRARFLTALGLDPDAPLASSA